MYDQPFTSAWIFDRCQEGAVLFNLPTMLILSLIFGLLVFYFFRKKLRKKIISSLIASALTMISSLIFLFIFVIFVGYGILFCAANGRYWPPLWATAYELNSALNHLYTYSQPLPKNEEELQATFPDLYASTTAIAKIKYLYDPSKNRYILAVRSSKYNLQVFDSKIGLINFNLGWASFFSGHDEIPKFFDQNEYDLSIVPD